MQLVAYGAQDVYLTGNPQITFFKVVYRRHTNFSMEMDELALDNARPGNTYNLQVLRNGDLATKMYLRLRTPALSGGTTTSFAPFNSDPIQNTKVAWVRRLGHACIKSFKVQIGGTDIDKHVGVWLDLWYELTHTVTQERGYQRMIGDVPELTTLTSTSSTTSVTLIDEYTMYIPMQFWFNRNPGLALPLIALQYHEVRVQVELEELTKLIVWTGSTAPNYSVVSGFVNSGLMVDYIYLDSEERRRFAQVGHEYLIEQVQFPGNDSINATMSNSITHKTKLQFNHPCKELIWAYRVGAYNGEGNKTASSARGRFLCYSNTDNWSAAVDYAAANLAYGTLVPAGGTVPTSATSASAFTLTSALGAKASVTQQHTVTTPAGKYVYYSITITNSSSAVIPSTTPFATPITNPMSLSSVNLLDSLARDDTITPNALIICSVTMSSASASTISTNIAVTGHQLTLRDVSVPTKDYTDYRYTAGASLNPWDVAVIQPSNYGLRLDGAGNPVKSGNIQLNGQDRFDVVDGAYFNYVQPAQHHTRTPADGVNVYSFGLHPEQHQPSGTANLSRIDTTMLNLTLSDPYRAGKSFPVLNFVTDSIFYVFAVNYNILRVMSGMAGLAYAN